MPTFIKTGFWDKKAKAPDGWLDLNLFVQTLIPPTPPPTPSTNIYNSDGTLTGSRVVDGANANQLFFTNIPVFQITTGSFNSRFQVITDKIVTQYNTNEIGLKLDFANDIYTLGDFINTSYIQTTNNDVQIQAGNPGPKLILENINNTIKSTYQGNDIGLKLDFANRTYQLGQITGNNATTLKIDDAAAFPVQVSGTNVSSGTAGAASGQFLNVKVNGVDYKIALLNP
jgi:hypothetical protein